MHENPRDLALQCDLLALSAMLEAARDGQRDHEYALQAARLKSLSRQMQDRGKHAGPDADDPLRQLEQRLSTSASLEHDLETLATGIQQRAHRDTGYLQFEDVESRVVVYSKRDARDLQTQLARIDELRRALQARIASGREALASMADALKYRLFDQRKRSTKKPCPD